MANYRLNTDTAIYNTLNVQALVALAPGGVFNTLAPQTAPLPYVLFQMVSKNDDHTFNGRFAEGVYIVKGVSESPWPKAAADIDTQIDTLLEDASLTITGFNPILCRRESDFTLVEERDGRMFQHVGGLYRVIADQT